MVNFYNDRVCLNCLAGSVENAKEIYQAGEKHVLVGVLSSKYPSVEEAVKEMDTALEALAEKEVATETDKS